MKAWHVSGSLLRWVYVMAKPVREVAMWLQASLRPCHAAC